MRAGRVFAFFTALIGSSCAPPAAVPVDMERYDPSCGIEITKPEGHRLDVSWRVKEQEWGWAQFNLGPGQLLRTAGIGKADKAGKVVDAFIPIWDTEPLTFLTVGMRRNPPGRPPAMSAFNVFFDKPASRPYRTYLSERTTKQARVISQGRRATVILDGLTIGPFSGELQFTFYADCNLIHVEAVVSTNEDERAILYDAGLAPVAPGWDKLAWLDTEGRWQRSNYDERADDRPVGVRHRALIAEGETGSIACFPPPHQYQFPRDWTDNLKFTWFGRNHHGLTKSWGFGIRQVADGGRAFEPWFNAPPKTQQRLGVFYLLSRGKAEQALEETLRYTHGDKFVPRPGHVTFTSHWHMAVAVQAMKRNFEGTPDFVKMFKEMGVNAVHLGDFHGDGHQFDPGPFRLPELEALFKECRRLSDDKLLMIPGEEINDYLGIREPGKHPGHWMSLFPKPVYWILRRSDDQPLVEQHPKYGTVYRVGNRNDVMEVLKREKGLAWVAHPRIKASNWTPDIFRHEDFYLSDTWLGGAWKAMPADLSRPKLGERVLDLLDDMANWGQRKYVPGEVDVFKIDHTHELYGHMNVNYLRLDRLPRFDEGWQPILDALRGGKFFVTTGEVLLHDFRVGGKESGETLTLKDDESPQLEAVIEGTFPLSFAEIISGDGKQVYRDRIDLSDTGPFAKKRLARKLDLRGRKWVRFETWDVAANGAFTQPVWISH